MCTQSIKLKHCYSKCLNRQYLEHYIMRATNNTPMSYQQLESLKNLNKSSVSFRQRAFHWNHNFLISFLNK